MRSRASVAFAALMIVAGCARDRPRASVDMVRYEATGLASWYGEEAAGRRTASGEPFDPDAITVAHRTLPLGSYVAVTALDTGRTVVARVNDRGPVRRDRLVDLSRGAAQALGTDRSPIARVRIRSVSQTAGKAFRPASPPPRPRDLPSASGGAYAVRVATFADERRAQALARTLSGDAVRIGRLWRVRLGPYELAEAQRARDAVVARGYGDAQIVPAD